MRKYNSQQNPDQNSSQPQDRNPGQEEQSKFNYFQTLLQNYLLNSQGVTAHNSSGASDRPACEDHLCSSGMITSLFEVVESQTHSLEILNQKITDIVGQNKDLLHKVKMLEAENLALRSSERKLQQPELAWKEPINELKIEGESVNRDTLLDILFGKQKYQYQLRLAEPLDQPLYRERNFSIIMELVDLTGHRVQNSNKIPMSLALYTCENPPKFIEKNTAGQKMLKGYVDQALIQGTCHFEKVQIREVTSHYRSGWIFLVAIPCMTPLGANKSENSIDFTKIKPLVIDEVVVKAKKPKKKQDKKEDSEEGM